MKKLSCSLSKVVTTLSLVLFFAQAFAQEVELTEANGKLRLNWDAFTKALEPRLRKVVPELRDLRFALYQNGLEMEAATSLPWSQRQLEVTVPEGQMDYYLEIRTRAGKVLHRSPYILREVFNSQVVAPESFSNLTATQPLRVVLPESLKRSTGYSGVLTDLAYRLGYKKVVWILKETADPALRKLIEGLKGSLGIRINMNGDGTPRSVLVLNARNEVLSEVAPENFYFKVDAAFNGNAFFWDDMLVCLATVQHHPWLVQSTIQFWLDVQAKNSGLIPREVRKTNMLSFFFPEIIEVGRPTRPNLQLINPYLMDWVADELFRYDPSKENRALLMKVAQSIEDYTEWMKKNRSVYTKGGKWIGYVISALGSGLDDSRGRRGDYYTPEASETAWVDLISHHVSMHKHLVTWYEMFLKDENLPVEDKKKYELKLLAARREVTEKEAILNTLYWNEEEALYFDLIPDGTGGHKHDMAYYSISGLWPLYSGSVPEERFARFVEKNFAPERFGGEFPLPANSRHHIPQVEPEEDGYWAKWSHWPSMAATVARGFSLQGKPDLAADVTFKFLRGMEEASTATIAEFYGEFFQGGRIRSRIGQLARHHTRLDFTGWGKTPPIYNLIKYGLGMRPEADGTVTWNPTFELQVNERVELRNILLHGKRMDLVLKRNADGTYAIEAPSGLVVRSRLIQR